jgi:acyl carrier protein
MAKSASPRKNAAEAKSGKNHNGKGSVAAAVPKPAKPAPRSDLGNKIVHLIAEEMAVEEAELTPNASFKDDLHLDEIDVAELLMQAEHAFGVGPFSESDWEKCATVEDFIRMVSKRVEAKRSRKSARG